MRSKSPLKRVAVIPTLLTLGNAACGFSSIIWASKIDFTPTTEWYFALSGWLIIAAMLFDAVDGYVARLSRTASKFGGELDSLCDAISFGAAPAYLLLKVGPGWEPRPQLHQILVGISTLYLICTLLRLARFNVENSPDPAAHKRFRGLPSPGAAGCLASLAILRVGIEKYGGNAEIARGYIEFAATLGAFCVALLMVSRVPYPHVTKQILRGRKPFTHLVQIIIAGFIIVLNPEIALVLLFWLYSLGMAIRYTILRSLRHDSQSGTSGAEDSSRR